jgi:hypothetical protein
MDVAATANRGALASAMIPRAIMTIKKSLFMTGRSTSNQDFFFASSSDHEGVKSAAWAVLETLKR